jgi:hypothetical protein
MCFGLVSTPLYLARTKHKQFSLYFCNSADSCLFHQSSLLHKSFIFLAFQNREHGYRIGGWSFSLCIPPGVVRQDGSCLHVKDPAFKTRTELKGRRSRRNPTLIERSRLFFASSANRIYTTHLSSFQVCPCPVLRCLFHLNHNIV